MSSRLFRLESVVLWLTINLIMASALALSMPAKGGGATGTPPRILTNNHSGMGASQVP